ncbi:uncharacterized protein C1orf232 homolog [Pyxicephalus adspersus]|uniref:uncharacterized protein C1orf232 homolog n=1 Tax=Pyxicephalus adspersus TaxID=30357 RepID=UPI003B5C5A1D
MSQSFWKIYKAKVLQTFGTEQDGETFEESNTSEVIQDESQDNEVEGLNMSQLARKVQGAFGWRSVTSLFTKDDEHRSDQDVEQMEEQVPEEAPQSSLDYPSEKRSSPLWDVFTSRWQQRSAEHSEAQGVLADPPEQQNEVHQAEETPFKWSFLTSKLAELRSKND